MTKLNINATFSEVEYLKAKGVFEYLEKEKKILVKCYEAAEKNNDENQIFYFKNAIDKQEFDLRLSKSNMEHWYECCIKEEKLTKMWELERLKEQNPIGGTNPWDL